MKPSEIVRERGWIQHMGIGPNGEVCMGTAICLAAHPGKACIANLVGCRWEPFKAATGASVTAWNDARGRTIEQVIALLQEFETAFDAAPQTPDSAPVVAVPA